MNPIATATAVLIALDVQNIDPSNKIPEDDGSFTGQNENFSTQ
jgi:hypothetical protein